MGNLINRLLLFLCCQIFETIESVYRLFYGLATTRLFNEDTIRMVSNRLYILVSIVILFAFAVKLIEAIVNPDLLTDSKKGVTGVLKRTIIGLMLIASVPAMFNLAYKINSEVISTSLVEKIILGQTKASSDSNNTAGVLTSSIIRGFVYPIDKAGIPINEESLCGDDENCNFAEELVSLNTSYQKYVSVIGANPNYEEIADISVESEWDNDQKMYHFSLFILLIVSIYILYQVIILCFDAALRLVNLGILEIMAPLVIVAYMGGGTDYLSKWAKMVAEKFLSIFARIAALAFMALGLNLMFDKDSIFNNDSATFMFKLLVIIGLLRLVKDLPNIIGKIFGVNIKDPGGIKGRLGEMAGIGKMASDAWTGLGNTAKKYGKGIAATAGLGAAGAAGKVVGNAAKKFDKKVLKGAVGNTAKKISESKLGRYSRVAKAGIKTGGKGTAKALQEGYDKEFKDVEYKKKEAIKNEKAKKNDARVAKASSGVLRTGNNGKIDFNDLEDRRDDNGNVIERSQVHRIVDAGGQNVNNGLISGSGLDAKTKDVVQKYSDRQAEAKRDARNLTHAQERKQNRQEMIDKIQSAIAQTDNSTTKSELTNLINDINNGQINDLDALNSGLRGLSFADKSMGIELADRLVDSIGDTVNINGRNVSSQELKENITSLRAKYASGEIGLDQFTAGLEGLKGQGVSDELIDDVIKGARESSDSDSTAIVNGIMDIATKEGAIGVSSDQLDLDVSTAQENASRSQTAFEKAKDSYQKMVDSLIDDSTVKDTVTHLGSTIDKVYEAEDRGVKHDHAQDVANRNRYQEDIPDNNQNNGN